MSLIRFGRVGKEYAARWVLRGVSFQVGFRERWGIVGRNGAGKTTLLRLITGDASPSEGEVWRHPGLGFTLLRQERGEDSEETVGEAALAPFAELLEMERRLERESEALAGADPASPESARRLQSYDRLVEEFRRRGGYALRSRSEAALEGLGFAPPSWSKPIRSLSGGELGRLRLVQTLLAEPDVLLLDEPTNHLDLRSTEWLEAFLRDYRGTVLLVSHDRVFLQRLCDHVLHVGDGTAVPYNGGYDAFLVQREERRILQLKQWEQQQAHVARTEDFIRRNLAGQKTKQAKSRRTQLARLERVERPTDEARAMALRFGETRRSGGTLLRLDGVGHGFGERALFDRFSAEVRRDERIALVGPNGCGKSTLLRILAGELAPLRGSLERGTGVRAAYYRQDFTHLDATRTVREEVSASAPAASMPDLRHHLGRFLFSGDEIEARVGDLSGGEQARVALAKVVLERPNLLLLDEPTNHLDIPSREALEASLAAFDGTVVLISHDRAFLSEVATRIWGFAEDGSGHVEDYPGGFDDWVAHRAERAAAAASQARPAAAAPQRTPDAAPREGLSKNEVRRREQELQRLEARIDTLEEQIAETERRLADPALYANGEGGTVVQGLLAARTAARAELAELYAAWERVGEELGV